MLVGLDLQIVEAGHLHDITLECVQLGQQCCMDGTKLLTDLTLLNLRFLTIACIPTPQRRSSGLLISSGMAVTKMLGGMFS